MHERQETRRRVAIGLPTANVVKEKVRIEGPLELKQKRRSERLPTNKQTPTGGRWQRRTYENSFAESELLLCCYQEWRQTRFQRARALSSLANGGRGKRMVRAARGIARHSRRRKTSTLTSSLVVRPSQMRYVWKPDRPTTDQTLKKHTSNSRTVGRSVSQGKHSSEKKTSFSLSNVRGGLLCLCSYADHVTATSSAWLIEKNNRYLKNLFHVKAIVSLRQKGKSKSQLDFMCKNKQFTYFPNKANKCRWHLRRAVSNSARRSVNHAVQQQS